MILDIKSGKVEPWAALQTAAYEAMHDPVIFNEADHSYDYNGRKLPSVTEILAAEGFINKSFYDERSRQRGEYVHLATELDDLGQLDESTVDGTIRPYLEAWRAFKCDIGLRVVSVELSLANATYGYAGTIDRVCESERKTNITRAAVELHNDGRYKLISFTDKQDIYIFQAATAIHHWKINNLKRK